MIDNEIIREIRETREKLWEESGANMKQFFEVLIERQKKRPNLVSAVDQEIENTTMVEEPKTGIYNAKD